MWDLHQIVDQGGVVTPGTPGGCEILSKVPHINWALANSKVSNVCFGAYMVYVMGACLVDD